MYSSDILKIQDAYTKMYPSLNESKNEEPAIVGFNDGNGNYYNTVPKSALTGTGFGGIDFDSKEWKEFDAKSRENGNWKAVAPTTDFDKSQVYQNVFKNNDKSYWDTFKEKWDENNMNQMLDAVSAGIPGVSAASKLMAVKGLAKPVLKAGVGKAFSIQNNMDMANLSLDVAMDKYNTYMANKTAEEKKVIEDGVKKEVGSVISTTESPSELTDKIQKLSGAIPDSLTSSTIAQSAIVGLGAAIVTFLAYGMFKDIFSKKTEKKPAYLRK